MRVQFVDDVVAKHGRVQPIFAYASRTRLNFFRRKQFRIARQDLRLRPAGGQQTSHKFFVLRHDQIPPRRDFAALFHPGPLPPIAGFFTGARHPGLCNNPLHNYRTR